jgi:SNF2 family DNA or RNA helicase
VTTTLDAPPALLHGELTPDGRTIVLIGTGTDLAIAQMAQRIQLMTPLIKPSDPPGALLCPATWAAVVQLSHLFRTAWRPGPRLTQWLMAETVLRAPDGGELTVALPEGLVPRPYQVDGARMIGALGRALLFDEAGTGKTITTILGLRERAAAGHLVTPVIVIAPASVVDPWVDAVRTWAPDWRVNAWRGSPDHRRRLAARDTHTQAHVVVASYDTARMDAAKNGPLAKLGARSVVVDECHQIKSPHAARSVAARRLAKRADNFVALSGTPITHHPGDLWPTLEALAPLAWPSGERWKARYCLTIPGDYSAKVIGLNDATEPEMRTTLLGQHRRVAKADVLTQLPPKVYSVRQVELPPAYRKAYDQMENDMLAELPGGVELSVMSVLAQLTRLQQLASAATEITTTSETVLLDGLLIERPHVEVRLRAPSWKIDALLEILAERPGEPVVTFAPSRQLMQLAGEQATAAGLEVGYVVGGQSMKARTETVEAFQRGKLDLLCVTTGAGGVGLTLTAAKTVVFLQRPWSLVEASQAEDRCHRIGSEIHDSIEVIDVVATKTIDTRIRAVLHEKAGQLADLLNDRRIVTELLGGSTLRKAS